MADFDRPPRVLVVEDDDAIAQVLMRSLRMEGYEVRIAQDGPWRWSRPTPFCPTSSCWISACRGWTDWRWP